MSSAIAAKSQKSKKTNVLCSFNNEKIITCTAIMFEEPI